ncbi:MAG: carboxypeptidase regulatory-like domain-containing protein [Acidobacteria bacterium]|nr:MAG: carboxypeptidase regulatory-like domain-containing protein [Acidobacteriota bacterium]
MKTVRIRLLIFAFISFALVLPLLAQVDAPQPQTGSIIGTVTDANDAVVPGAAVVLEGPGPGDRRTIVTNDMGFYNFGDLKPSVPYHITVSAKGFADWTSPEIVLRPSQVQIITGSKLRVAETKTAIDVTYSAEEIATQQVKVAETQRILGFFPNFYAVYEPNAAPLTPKLKFRLAMKVAMDPVTLAATTVMAGLNQASDRPNYVQGAKGFGQRWGAIEADSVSQILIAGAVLPTILHQDPRYFYKGTGTTKSRFWYAVGHPFFCKGDNGRWQPNYSSLGGDLASASLSNLYYPDSNRGAGLVFSSFAVNTAVRAVSSLAQEFIFRRISSSSKKPK